MRKENSFTHNIIYRLSSMIHSIIANHIPVDRICQVNIIAVIGTNYSVEKLENFFLDMQSCFVSNRSAIEYKTWG